MMASLSSSCFLTLALLALLLASVSASTTTAVEANTSGDTAPTSVKAGKNLLKLCSRCQYDAQCTSCKCVNRRCVPEHKPTYICKPPKLPPCGICKTDGQCSTGKCIYRRCAKTLAGYYNCPGTRKYCDECKYDITCGTGKCIVDRCAKSREDYFRRCPYTRVECDSCNKPTQCRKALTCYHGRCVQAATKGKLYRCPGTRPACELCGSSKQCSHGLGCYNGRCAVNKVQALYCTQCCFRDRCSKMQKCVVRGRTFNSYCTGKTYRFDKYTCKPTITRCCFKDACNDKTICCLPGGILRDSCRNMYDVRTDCKLVKRRSPTPSPSPKPKLCCYKDPCGGGKNCVRRGGILVGKCGAKFDVGRDCKLKRRSCCYKVPCSNYTYCRDVGTIIKTHCGTTFRVGDKCQVVAHMLTLKNDASQVSKVAAERVEMVGDNTQYTPVLVTGTEKTDEPALYGEE